MKKFPILIFIASLYTHADLVNCNGDIYDSNYDNIETTSIIGTIFNLTPSQLNDCAVYVNWKFAAYPLSNGTYVLHNIIPGKYIITISHPELIFHDVFINVTRIHGTFRVFASRYSPYHEREGKSWDRIAHQPISQYSEINNSSFINKLDISTLNILGLLSLLFTIYSVFYKPMIHTQRKLFATLFEIEWLSKKSGHGRAQTLNLTREYFDKDSDKSDLAYKNSEENDWGAINNVEVYSQEITSPFISKILSMARSIKP